MPVPWRQCRQRAHRVASCASGRDEPTPKRCRATGAADSATGVGRLVQRPVDGNALPQKVKPGGPVPIAHVIPINPTGARRGRPRCRGPRAREPARDALRGPWAATWTRRWVRDGLAGPYRSVRSRWSASRYRSWRASRAPSNAAFSAATSSSVRARRRSTAVISCSIRCDGGRHWTRTSDLLHVKRRAYCVVPSRELRTPRHAIWSAL